MRIGAAAVIAQNVHSPIRRTPPAPSAGKPATVRRRARRRPRAAPGRRRQARQRRRRRRRKDTAAEDEADKDPYEGIAPEELPPDLQYSADSSVSFPTNI